MSRIRTLGVAALMVAVAAMVSSTRAADETKKKEHGGVHGVVTKIVKDTETTGSFTVKVEEKKDKAAAGTKTTDAKAADAAGDEVKFKVTADTKFTKVAHKKKDASAADAKTEAEGEAATFADLKEDDHVVVEATDGVATSVKIHAGKKKKPV